MYHITKLEMQLGKQFLHHYFNGLWQRSYSSGDRIHEFVLRFTDNCDTDFVEVSYDGGSIGKFCGKYPNPNMPSRRLTVLSSGAGLINS